MTMFTMMMKMVWMKVLMITKSSEKVEQLQRRGSKKDLRLSSRRSSGVVEVKKKYDKEI